MNLEGKNDRSVNSVMPEFQTLTYILTLFKRWRGNQNNVTP